MQQAIPDSGTADREEPNSTNSRTVLTKNKEQMKKEMMVFLYLILFCTIVRVSRVSYEQDVVVGFFQGL